jgi:serine/threonine protein kinase
VSHNHSTPSDIREATCTGKKGVSTLNGNPVDGIKGPCSLIRHSNVASVFHLGRSGENYFYAMEFVEGETLENLIKRSGRLEVKLALEIGTPHFASPEQFAGVRVDIRSDLYALGVTFWMMLTGKTPFLGTPAEIVYQHQHVPLPLNHLIDIPQPVVVLMEGLLDKDPNRRFQNPARLVEAMPAITAAIDAGRRITRQRLEGERAPGLGSQCFR